MQADNQRVLALGAHPDDIESFCAGTLFLLREAGFEIHVATMTLGDCGSRQYSAAEIQRLRRNEAEAGCAFLGASYHYVGFKDLCIFNDDVSNRRTTALVREVNPFLVMTHPPHDYMSDHEATSVLGRNACFSAPAPNYDTMSFTTAGRASDIPYLYYFEPMDAVDIYGKTVAPQFYVDITTSIEQRLQMLSLHKSQRQWLLDHHGLDDYVDAARARAHDAGERASSAAGRPITYAEGFRQHLGHAYPHENILARILEGRIVAAATGQ